MKPHKERVQEYVREQCGLDGFTVMDVKPGDVVSINHKDAQPLPVELHHYLSVLVGKASVLPHLEGGVLLVTSGGKDIGFSLTTGQPATKKDWEIMSNLLGL